MFKFPTHEKYYSLQKDSSKKNEYEKLLINLSNKTTSREYFETSTISESISPQRANLHNHILESELKKYKPSKKPKIHFIVGSIGSGKTSTRDSIMAKEDSSFIDINFDKIKKELPEYKVLQKLNLKKAASFVQSESARLAGKLFKKSIQKKYNIIFEKNIRKNKNNKFHLKEEIKNATKKGYVVFIHVVFLDSHKEAWSRVQKRTEKIKRFVPRSEVRKTFNNLFINFNIVYEALSTESFYTFLWYNGSKFEVDSSALIAFIANGKFSKYNWGGLIKNLKNGSLFKYVNETRLRSLPKKTRKKMKKLDFLKEFL